MAAIYVGDDVRLEHEGEHFALRLGSTKRRYLLTRHGVHVLMAEAANALHSDHAEQAEIVHVPFKRLRD